MLPHLQSLINTPDTKVTTLPNGLRVASENSGGSTCTVSPSHLHVCFRSVH